MHQFDQPTITTLRDVLREAAAEVSATTATEVKMAETLTRRAADSRVSREEIKEVALEAGRTPTSSLKNVRIDAGTSESRSARRGAILGFNLNPSREPAGIGEA